MIKVSVLVATKNRSYFLPGCLDSLIYQTYVNNLEVIIINTPSEGNDKDIAQHYQLRFPFIKYIEEPIDGLYRSWNTGIKMAQGKYLINLNTDDRLEKMAIENLATYLDNHPDIGLVYGESIITNRSNGNFNDNLQNTKLLQMPAYSHKLLLMKNICGPHPMWRKSLHDQFGLFDETLKVAGDYEFWLRCAEHVPMAFCDNIVGLYYENLEGLALSNMKITIKETETIQKKYFTIK